MRSTIEKYPVGCCWQIRLLLANRKRWLTNQLHQSTFELNGCGHTTPCTNKQQRKQCKKVLFPKSLVVRQIPDSLHPRVAEGGPHRRSSRPVDLALHKGFQLESSNLQATSRLFLMKCVFVNEIIGIWETDLGPLGFDNICTLEIPSVRRPDGMEFHDTEA